MAEAGAEEAPAAPADPVPSPAHTPTSTAGSWPDFAVVCSFLERYGAVLDLPELTFPELEEALEETGAGEGEERGAGEQEGAHWISGCREMPLIPAAAS